MLPWQVIEAALIALDAQDPPNSPEGKADFIEDALSDAGYSIIKTLSPPDCCGHAVGAHECGLCQEVIYDYFSPGYKAGDSPKFCPCPMNDPV